MPHPSHDFRGRSHVVTLDTVCAVCDCYHGSRKLLTVLDVGAGDGRLAGELFNRGFQVIDAVDSSKSKLSLLKRQVIYDNYYTCSDSYSYLPIDDGVYDLVMAVGCFGPSHAHCSAIAELARVTKPEGLLVLYVEENDLNSWIEYKNRLETEMMALQTDGIMEIVTRELVPSFSGHQTGIVYIFKKC